MKYILPVFLAFILLANSCSKDKQPEQEGTPPAPGSGVGTSGDKNLPLAQREKIKSDSLFALYGLRFEKPLELSSVSFNNFNLHFETNLIYYIGFRNGDPWLAIYDRNSKLLKEHTQALPDSIKKEPALNNLQSYRGLEYEDVLIISGVAGYSHEPNTTGNTLASDVDAAHLMYYYDIGKNEIRMKVISYKPIEKLDISSRMHKWYDGAFVMEGRLGNESYYVISKNLDIIDTYRGNHEYSAKKGSYNFHFTWYGNKYYPTSMSEYFEIKTNGTDVIIENKSIKSVLITPEYPSLPYYSYIISSNIIEAIARPENFAQLNDQKSSINDLGDRLEVSIEGLMLLSDDESKSFYEEKVSGKVYIDKKTGKEIK